MANNISHLPHIKNMTSGIEKYDPVHKSIFEVYFELPATIQSQFQQDVLLLTEQVKTVSGLDILQKTTPAGEQKFYGVTVSYLNPVLDQTAADLTMTFNLNLRNVTDNFVLNVFRAWENLSYDLSDGTRSIKTGYISDYLRIAEANRDGTIWRSYIFHHIMLTDVNGLNDLDYQNSDAIDLTCAFRCDYWDYEDAD
jgi:hypothetical protein